MKRSAIVLATLVLAATSLRADTVVRRKQVLSKIYKVERIYKSMEGPYETRTITLGDEGEMPELVWVKSVRTDIVGEDGKTPANSEFMCHMNVDIDPVEHQAMFELQRSPSPRMFTLSQGVFEARLPDGYGYAVMSNEPLRVFTQVLNHNVPHPKNIRVRHLVTIEYIRDRDLKEPIKPLFPLNASGMVELQETPEAITPVPALMTGSSTDTMSKVGSNTHGTVGIAMAGMDHHGPSCIIAPRAPNGMPMSDYVAPDGKKMTGHWVVPPGKQVNTSDATWFMGLGYDTKIHYAVVHLHPFAQSITLRDKTTGKDVWCAKAIAPKKGRIGLAHVDTLVSKEGIPLFKDHQYEMVSVYDNTLKVNADSMASMFMGVEDPEFRHFDPKELAMRALDFADQSSAVILRTSTGDAAITLARDAAPDAVRQFVRLVRAGVYQNVPVTKIASDGLTFAPTLNAEQKQLVVASAAQNTHHAPGDLSICPGETSFTVVLSNHSDREGRCTVFGHIGPGSGAIREMSGAPHDETGKPTIAINLLKTDLYDAKQATELTLAPARAVAQ